MKPYTQQSRQTVIDLYESGKTMTQISEEQNISYKTVQAWIKRYNSKGEKGLLPLYSSVGAKPTYSSAIFEKAKEYKKAHPLWGAPFILLKLADEFVDEKLPTARRLQQIFAQNKLQPPKNRLPNGDGKWAKKAFDCVQVDAKERLKTKDGQDCCYLNFADEYTGSELDAFIFPLCSNL